MEDVPLHGRDRAFLRRLAAAGARRRAAAPAVLAQGHQGLAWKHEPVRDGPADGIAARPAGAHRQTEAEAGRAAQRCQVVRPDGVVLGEITKQIRLGRARFTLLDPRGARLGEVRARNWRAKDFSVLDGAGQPIARVTKRWAGLRELFTDADTYVVEVSPAAVDPLRSLAVATCLVIDVVMKQKDYDN
ncbi:MAG TPA: phospholipid scramblase-related protein [Actinomycetes bacterium]|nr:phospholipid scramblase-related protein [Actinomycetes bacterium]